MVIWSFLDKIGPQLLVSSVTEERRASYAQFSMEGFHMSQTLVKPSLNSFRVDDGIRFWLRRTLWWKRPARVVAITGNGHRLRDQLL